MAAQTLRSYDASLKDLYQGMIRKVLNRRVHLLSYVKRGSKPFEGRQVVFPFNLMGSSASGWFAAGNTLPVARPQITKDFKVPMRNIWAHIQVNKDVISAAKSNRGSFERVLAFEVKRMVQDVMARCNRALWGTGHGKLGEILSVATAGSPTRTTLTMRSLAAGSAAGSGINGNASNRYVRPGVVNDTDLGDLTGDTLDIYAVNGTTLRVLAVQVLTVSAANNTILLSTDQSGAGIIAGDGIYLAHPGGVTPGSIAQGYTAYGDGEPMGVGGIIDDGTFVPILHNIDKSLYPVIRGNVINAGATAVAPGALSLTMLQRGIDVAAQSGAAEMPNVGVMGYDVRREVQKLMQQNVRYVKKHDLWQGIKENRDFPWETSLEYGGVPHVVEDMCPWQTIFYIPSNLLRMYIMEEFDWLEGGSGPMGTYLLPTVAGTYAAQGYMAFNMSVDDVSPSSGTVIRNISCSEIDRSEAALW